MNKSKYTVVFIAVLIIISTLACTPVFSASDWVEYKAPITDYSHSFAVIGDTQKLIYFYPEKYTDMYDWIIDNAESKRIKYVIGLGDITDTDTQREWTLARNTMKKLESVVPFTLVRGSHDSTNRYNRYFPYGDFEKNTSGSFDNTMLNTYVKFSIDDKNYMIVNLDCGADDTVLEWANKIVFQNQDHNVIVVTHIYMDENGNLIKSSDNTDRYGTNGGEDIWNKFVKKHNNIFLVLSGHSESNRIIKKQTLGDNGNTVTQIMINPQSADLDYEGLGLVALLYFSTDGKHIDVEYYSTSRKQYYMKDNQFRIELKSPEETDTPPLETDQEITSSLDTTTSPETSQTTATVTTKAPSTEVTTIPDTDNKPPVVQQTTPPEATKGPDEQETSPETDKITSEQGELQTKQNTIRPIITDSNKEPISNNDTNNVENDSPKTLKTVIACLIIVPLIAVTIIVCLKLIRKNKK